jgi:hypothetical protein
MKFECRDTIDIQSCLFTRLHGAAAEQCFGKSFARIANTVHFASVPSGSFSKSLKPATEYNNIFKALLFRLDVIEDALKGAQKESRFLLYLFLDEHLHLVEAFKSGNLENLRSHYPRPEFAISPLNTFDISMVVRETRFWSNTKPSKVLDLKVLFCKSLPNRSSARNLQPLFKKYFAEHKQLFQHILQIALLGNYRFSFHKLNFKLRNAVYSMTEDDCMKVIDSNVQLAILSVKLFLINEIRSLPSLRAVLLKNQWQKVENSCIGLLKRWAHTIPELLKSHAKSKAKVGKTASAEAAFKSVAKKICSSLAPRRLCEDFHLFYRLSMRVHATEIPFFLLNAFGLHNKTILTLESIARGTAAASTLHCSEESSQVIATFLEAFEIRFHVKIFNLPMHVAEAQREALVQRFELKEESSDEVEKAKAEIHGTVGVKNESVKEKGNPVGSTLLLDKRNKYKKTVVSKGEGKW